MLQFLSTPLLISFPLWPWVVVPVRVPSMGQIVLFNLLIGIIIDIGLMSWVLPIVRETGVQSQVKSYQRLKKMLLDAALLNIQHYKVQIKGKVEQSREWNSTLPYTSVKLLFKREPSGHPRLWSPTYHFFFHLLLILNRIIGVKKQYLKPFHCVQTNELCFF